MMIVIIYLHKIVIRAASSFNGVHGSLSWHWQQLGGGIAKTSCNVANHSISLILFMISLNMLSVPHQNVFETGTVIKNN